MISLALAAMFLPLSHFLITSASVARAIGSSVRRAALSCVLLNADVGGLRLVDRRNIIFTIARNARRRASTSAVVSPRHDR